MTALSSRMVCSACGAVVPDDEPRPFRCPNAPAARADGDVDHVLARDLDLAGVVLPDDGEPNPFVRYRELLHTYRYARRAGEPDGHFVQRVRGLDARVAEVDGHGFAETPCAPSPELAAELGVAEVWVKDETGGVAGSHKARHLMGILLQLGAPGAAQRPLLGIASCGNAALAAAALARAAELELEAYVPEEADAAVKDRLRGLGVELVTCARDGQPGDPCFRRLQRRAAEGVVPFTCQGSENGLCIEGGETLFWELIARAPELDRIALQVGGGAFASAAVHAWRDARHTAGAVGEPRIHAVQTAGGHPLERAWRAFVQRVIPEGDRRADAELAGELEGRFRSPEVSDQLALAAARRSRYMRPWETPPHSVASGILDDETYDWRAVLTGMLASGGWPLVVDDELLLRARDLARERTGANASATGAAGLAGLLALAGSGQLGPDERVGLVLTGVQR